MDGEPPPSPPDLSVPVGESAIAVALAAALLGVVTVQSYLYFKRFLADGLFLKLTVAFLWSLLLFELVLSSTVVYTGRIFPSSAAACNLSWALTLPILVNLICSAVSQGFFVYTTYRLTPNIFLLLSQLCLLLSEIGFGMAVTVKITQAVLINPVQATMMRQWTGHVSGTLTCICDLVTAGALAWSINRRRSQTSRESILKILRLYVICTGLLTGTVSGLLALSSFRGWAPGTIIVGEALGPVSTVSFLANLHSRSLLYVSSGKSKAQGGDIASMFVTVVKEVDRESNHEGQYEYALRTRINRFNDNIEESKTYDDLPAFERAVTKTESCISSHDADLITEC